MAANITSLEDLRRELRMFANERDWDQYHSPKNLVMALVVEAAELGEHFQWSTSEESTNFPAEKRAKVADELADVLIYLVRLGDKLDINLLDAAASKLESNAKKYPPEKARGNSRKYTEL